MLMVSAGIRLASPTHDSSQVNQFNRVVETTAARFPDQSLTVSYAVSTGLIA